MRPSTNRVIECLIGATGCIMWIAIRMEATLLGIKTTHPFRPASWLLGRFLEKNGKN